MGRIDEQVQCFHQRMDTDLTELNEQIQALRIPTIAPRSTKSKKTKLVTVD